MEDQEMKADIASLIAPARGADEITPNDDEVLHQTTRSIYVGEAGDVSVEMADGMTVVFQAVPAGTFLPIRIRRLRATGTTTNAIVGLWWRVPAEVAARDLRALPPRPVLTADLSDSASRGGVAAPRGRARRRRAAGRRAAAVPRRGPASASSPSGRMRNNPPADRRRAAR